MMATFDDSDTDNVKIRDLRNDYYRAVYGKLLFLACFAVASYIFWDRLPRWSLLLWFIPSAVFIAVWLSITVYTALREPVEPRVSQIWEPVTRYMTLASMFVPLGTIPVMLPYATQLEQMMMLVMAATFAPVTVMTTTEKSQNDRIVTIGFSSTIALYYLFQGTKSGLVIGLMTILYGLTIYSLGKHVRRTLRATAEAWQHSDQISADLEIALARATAERDAKTRFIASASHDLSLPLQAARLFLDQALNGRTAAQRESAVAGMHRAFDRSEALLSQMLVFLRMESSMEAPVLRRIELGPVIANLAEDFELAARNADIDIHAMPSHACALADQDLLNRTLGNLVQNAIVHSKGKRLVIGVRRQAPKLRILVIDDGNGIPANDIPLVFEAYLQGSDHGTELRGGFGLGLASASRMARLMNGSVGLDRRWSRGAAFFLELQAL
jgi:signal transduction histidine kinase